MRKSNVLYGGRKTRKASQVVRGERLGGRSEGEIHEVSVILGRGKKARAVVLAEKEFCRANPPNPKQPNFRNALRQFRVMHKMQTINHKERLGLPILPTIRLRVNKEGKRTLLVTRLKNVLVRGAGGFFLELPGATEHVSKVQFIPLNREQMQALREKIVNYEKIAWSHGFDITAHDVWAYTWNPEKQVVEPWIADFGNINELSQRLD